MMNERLEKTELEAAGKALFGENWKSPLARSIGVQSIRIREVMRDERPCPPQWTKKILSVLEEHSQKCMEAHNLILS